MLSILELSISWFLHFSKNACFAGNWPSRVFGWLWSAESIVHPTESFDHLSLLLCWLFDCVSQVMHCDWSLNSHSNGSLSVETCDWEGDRVWCGQWNEMGCHQHAGMEGQSGGRTDVNKRMGSWKILIIFRRVVKTPIFFKNQERDNNWKRTDIEEFTRPKCTSWN